MPITSLRTVDMYSIFFSSSICFVMPWISAFRPSLNMSSILCEKDKQVFEPCKCSFSSITCLNASNTCKYYFSFHFCPNKSCDQNYCNRDVKSSLCYTHVNQCCLKWSFNALNMVTNLVSSIKHVCNRLGNLLCQEIESCSHNHSKDSLKNTNPTAIITSGMKLS